MSEEKKTEIPSEVKKMTLTLLAAAGIGALVFAYAPRGWLLHGSAEQMVIVDPIKISNAQKALAMKWMAEKKDQTQEATLSDLFQVSHKVQEIIKNRTKGKIVLVKQAVVSSDLPDITNDVLKEAGLPTNAPTIDISKQLEIAPTSYMDLGKSNDGNK